MVSNLVTKLLANFAKSMKAFNSDMFLSNVHFAELTVNLKAYHLQTAIQAVEWLPPYNIVVLQHLPHLVRHYKGNQCSTPELTTILKSADEAR